jgi:predicted SprT family Zn-dependent metalloprotease
MGIKMLQVWMATLDDRTRHEHRQLDGQKRKVGEPFEVEGEKIFFPGDPAAEPYLTYNCRCTLVGEVKGVDYNLSDVSQRDNKLGDMTYEEWKDSKQKQDEGESDKQKKPETKEEQPKQEENIQITTTFFPDYITNSVNETLNQMNSSVGRRYREAIDNSPKKSTSDGTAYNPDSNSINYNDKELDELDTDTILHETTHYIDYNTPMVYEERSIVSQWARDENGELLERDGSPYKVEEEEVFRYDCKSCTSWISFSYSDDERVEDWKKAAAIIGVTENNSTPYGEMVDSADLTARRAKFKQWVEDNDISLEDLPHISDVMSSFLEGQLPFSLFEGGHDASYWNSDTRKQYSECIAAYSVLRSRNSKSLELMKEICPNLNGYLETVYKEMFGI